MTENSNDSKYRKFLNRLGEKYNNTNNYLKKNPGAKFNVASSIFMPILEDRMRRGQKKFENTAQGEYLKKRADRGMGLATENAMLRRTARNVMPMVNDARARYSGMIAKNNLGGSISTARGLADIQSRGVDAMSNVQETIAEKDIAIRENARDQYEMLNAKDKDERSASRRGVGGKILQNLMGVAGDSFKKSQDIIDKQAQQGREIDAITKGQDPALMRKLYLKLLGDDDMITADNRDKLIKAFGLSKEEADYIFGKE